MKQILNLHLGTLLLLISSFVQGEYLSGFIVATTKISLSTTSFHWLHNINLTCDRVDCRSNLKSSHNGILRALAEKFRALPLPLGSRGISFTN